MKKIQVHASAYALTAVILASLVLLAVAPSGHMSRSASAQAADMTVLDWNLHAYNVFQAPPTAPVPGAGMPPPVALLYLAMVHGAIYDAVNMIEGGYQPYLADQPTNASASTTAAIATAAHHVIVGVETVPALSPAILARIEMLWADEIAGATSIDGPQAVAAGITAGETAAAAMLAARANDGRYEPFMLEAGSEPGEWRPAPPGFVSDPNAWVGRVDPFMMESTGQFRTQGPRSLTSGIYTREYNEVKNLGAIDSARSAEQEAIAQFFLANPIELYSRAFRERAAAEGLSTIEQARLFAMLNMAAADSSIACVDDKIHYGFWRPITAIRLGDEDGNPKTVGDPTWTPMTNTPPYSDHPSGYNCATAAFMHTAAQVFGNGRVDFSLVRLIPGQENVIRHYKRFVDVIDDTIDARIYQGIHFRTADEQGAGIGKDVVRWMSTHYFRPEQ